MQTERSPFWRGISRNTFLLGLVSLFNDVSSEMIAPLLPVFLKSVIGATTGAIGLVEGIAQCTASVLKPVSGWLSDRAARRRPGILLGYWISACARPLLSVSSVVHSVLLLRFADRVGKGFRTAPRDALIADSTPAGHRGKAFGFHRAMDNLGAAIGMLCAALILLTVTQNLRVIFWIAAFPSLAAVMLVAFGIREQRDGGASSAERQSDPQPASAEVPARRPLEPGLLKWYVVVFIFWLGNSADAFLILKAGMAGMRLWQLPLLMFATSVVRTLVSMPAGALSDRIGRTGVIVFGWLYYAAVYAGFAVFTGPIALFVLFSAYGAYYGLTEGAERALVVDLAPQARRATALGIYHFVAGAAALPASIICGLVWQWKALGESGPAVALGFGAACALTAAVLLLILNPEGAGQRGGPPARSANLPLT